MTRPWACCLALLALGCGRADKSPQPADSHGPPDSGDSGSPEDADGDGYTAAQGDCDEGDPGIHPGADELEGDATDDNCDGSLHPTVAISDLGTQLAGRYDDYEFGEVVTLVGATGDASGAALVSELARHAGQYGGDGSVQVWSAEAAAAGGEPGLTLQLAPEGGEGASFGQATAAVALSDESTAWIAGFDAELGFGGYCAWDSATAGEAVADDADACIAPFDDDVHDHAGYGFATGVDLDGDGAQDLAVAGTTQGGTAPKGNDRVGAVRVAWGPLGWETLSQEPEVVLTTSENAWSPRALHGGADLDGDGTPDLLVSDSEADTEAVYAGRVWLVPGGTLPAHGTEGLSGVDGDQPDAETGASLATLDLDGDDEVDLCVGAPLDDTPGDRGGRVGCFYGPLVERRSLGEADIQFLAEEANSWFGFSLATLDLAGGGAALAVGTPDDAYFGHGYPGKVYIYDPASPSAPAALLAGEGGDGLGVDVEGADADGDGRADLLVGAPFADPGGPNRGAAWLLRGGAGAW